MSAALAQDVKRLAAELGYAACGITSAEPFAEFRAAIRARIRRFPGAAALYEPMLARAEPRRGAPWARSVVVCLRRYGKYRLPPGLAAHIGRNYLCDRRNADCPDHPMPKQFQQGLIALGLRVRRGGTPDRWAAARAGVARVGRNCFACSEHGSWINIETWLVGTALPPDPPALDLPCPDGCRACMNACPTGALVEPLVMRMDRCVAYLSYHAPEPVDPALWEKMGPWIYGCDACQLACPLNKGAWEDLEPAPWLERLAPHLTPAALAEMDETTYREHVHPAFWYIPKHDLARWHRNAHRALASSG